MKVGGLKDPSIYCTILGLISYTLPSFIPPLTFSITREIKPAGNAIDGKTMKSMQMIASWVVSLELIRIITSGVDERALVAAYISIRFLRNPPMLKARNHKPLTLNPEL